MSGPVVEVAVAVIVQEGRVLLTRRRPDAHLGGMWEFPGGKLASGECPEEAVLREVFEETGLVVTPGRLLSTLTHEYPERVVRLHFFECSTVGGDLSPAEYDATWMPLENLAALKMPAANDPIIALITRGARPGGTGPTLK